MLSWAIITRGKNAYSEEEEGKKIPGTSEP